MQGEKFKSTVHHNYYSNQLKYRPFGRRRSRPILVKEVVP